MDRFGPTNPDRPRRRQFGDRERLDDVRPAPDAAVDIDFEIAPVAMLSNIAVGRRRRASSSASWKLEIALPIANPATEYADIAETDAES